MIDHAEAADSTEPTQTNEPIDSRDPNDPMDPIDSADPVDPMDSTESFEQMLSTEPSDLIDHLLFIARSCPATVGNATPGFREYRSPPGRLL